MKINRSATPSFHIAAAMFAFVAGVSGPACAKPPVIEAKLDQTIDGSTRVTGDEIVGLTILSLTGAGATPVAKPELILVRTGSARPQSLKIEIRTIDNRYVAASDAIALSPRCAAAGDEDCDWVLFDPKDNNGVDINDWSRIKGYRKEEIALRVYDPVGKNVFPSGLIAAWQDGVASAWEKSGKLAVQLNTSGASVFFRRPDSANGQKRGACEALGKTRSATTFTAVCEVEATHYLTADAIKFHRIEGNTPLSPIELTP